MSALVSSTTNLTIAIITSYVGVAGVAALAGYGAGARLEFILVPFTYGIGGPAGILIGTNIGAGQGGRALRTAWITLLLSALATETIGLAAATWPAAWIGSFSGDPAVLATGMSRDSQGEDGGTIWMRMPQRGCRREGVAPPVGSPAAAASVPSGLV